jgi:FkbM family methyltransferase
MFSMPPKETFLKQDAAYDHQRGLYTEAIKHCTQFRIAIDVGAHIGFFSSKMVKDFKEVAAFEPMFSKYLKENVPEDNLTIFPIGLSSHEATYAFNIREHHTGMSKIDKNGKDKIACIDLDSMGFTGVDLIKIDVESHEYFVIEGMRNFLKTNSPVIIIELNDVTHRANIIQTLKSHGYVKVLTVDTDYIFKKGK